MIFKGDPEMVSLSSYRRYFIVFLGIILLSFSCKRERKDLQSIIASFPPADPIKGISMARNPDSIFCKARIQGQVRNAIAIHPSGEVMMKAVYSRGQRLRFSYGVLEQAIGRADAPTDFYLKDGHGKGSEGILWEGSLDPCNKPDDRGWHEFEIILDDSGQGEKNLWFGTRAPEWGAVISNPRIVSKFGPARPSIIFILIDACRPDHLSCYGYRRSTSPRIDEIAVHGTRFETAITASPFTLTSVASMFSGMYPWDHGVIFTKGLAYPDDVPNMVEKLREGGYFTAAFSGTYFRFSANGFDRGFDVFDEACAESFFYQSADCMIERIKGFFKAHAGEEYFLYLHFVDPHAPYYSPEPFRDRFSSSLGFDNSAVAHGDAGRFGDGRKWYQIPLKPTDKDLEYLRALYDGEISYVDERIGKMLAEVRKSGMQDDTIIVVTADHGEAFYEHGRVEHRSSLYDETLKVPLIISGPGIPRRKVMHEQVRTIDFFPTLLDMAGIFLPEGIEGRSLVPLMQGQHLSPEPALAFRCMSLKKGHCEYVLRTPEEKLFLRLPGKTIEFYDIYNDPSEKNDLSSTEKERSRSILLKLESLIGGGSRPH
jgi:choline-sulfatase